MATRLADMDVHLLKGLWYVLAICALVYAAD